MNHPAKWVYISGKGGGGFTGSKVGTHLFGGPAALKFAGQPNSDVVDGKFRPDAPGDQLYDLTSDRSQSTNVVRKHAEVAQRMRKQLAEIQK